MDESLQSLLLELENLGTSNDSHITDRPYRMLNITPDTGQFLLAIVLSSNAKDVLEIGTSNGYSTIWLAYAVGKTGGSVTTLEKSSYKVELARENFRRSGLDRLISLINEDAQGPLSKALDQSFDLIFLDADRSEYLRLWPEVNRALRPGGSLVVDNAISHASELEPFMATLRSDPRFVTTMIPIGNGEFFAVKTV